MNDITANGNDISVNLNLFNSDGAKNASSKEEIESPKEAFDNSSSKEEIESPKEAINSSSTKEETHPKDVKNLSLDSRENNKAVDASLSKTKEKLQSLENGADGDKFSKDDMVGIEQLFIIMNKMMEKYETSNQEDKNALMEKIKEAINNSPTKEEALSNLETIDEAELFDNQHARRTVKEWKQKVIENKGTEVDSHHQLEIIQSLEKNPVESYDEKRIFLAYQNGEISREDAKEILDVEIIEKDSSNDERIKLLEKEHNDIADILHSESEDYQDDNLSEEDLDRYRVRQSEISQEIDEIQTAQHDDKADENKLGADSDERAVIVNKENQNHETKYLDEVGSNSTKTNQNSRLQRQ